MPPNAKRRPGGGGAAANDLHGITAENTATAAPRQQLPALAERINRAHDEAHQAARTAIEHAIECGRLLLEAKASVGHGGWIAWLAVHCDFSARSAQGYMRLARELPKLSPADAQRVADLSLRDAIGQLAQQSREIAKLPAPVAADVLAEAEDARLGDRLVYATNHQRRLLSPPDAEAEWTTVDLPARLPPPDRDLAERIAPTIDASGLDPLTVLETLNALYCEVQNRHQLVTPAGLPAMPPDEVAAFCDRVSATAEDPMAEGRRLALAVRDCSGLKRAAKEYVKGVCDAVDFWRRSGVPLNQLDQETRRDMKRWSRWARHPDQYEALIFSELYDTCFADLDDEPDDDCEVEP